MNTFLNIGTVWLYVFWILFLTTATYFAIFYLVYVRQTKRWNQSNIPFIQPTFLIGHKHLLKLGKYSMGALVNRICSENNDKKLFGVFLGPVPIIILKDQQLIQQVFVKHSKQTFSLGLILPEFEVEAQHSIVLAVDEEKWKFARTGLASIFTPNWFQGAKFKSINEATQELCRQIESQGGHIIVAEIAQNVVFHVMATRGFGEEGGHRHQIKDDLREIGELAYERTHSRLIRFMSLIYFPFLQRFEPCRFLSHKMCNLMSNILKQQIKLRDQMETEKGDIIDILRSLRDKIEPRNNFDKDLHSGNSVKRDTTMRKITGFGMVLVAGGSETVVSLTDFAVHVLSLYPEHQRKIRKEVRDALKNHGVSDFNYDVVRSLSFTFQCLFEVARLFPTAQLIYRQCTEDFCIPDTNYTLRKGDRVAIPLYSVGRDGTMFKDPHLFDPDRFYSKNSILNVPAALLSFGAGARRCPGYGHGLLLAASIVACIVQKYDIKPNSHVKLMDANEFDPKGLTYSPRRKIVVDLIQADNLDNNSNS